MAAGSRLDINGCGKISATWYAGVARAVSLMFGVMTTTVPAFAQAGDTGSSPPPHAIALTSEQLFAIAEQLAAAHRLREAIHFLEPLTTNPNADYRAEARVRIARYALAMGRKAEAVTWFEKLLAEKPDAAAVRVELAEVLAQMGNVSGASHQMQRAAAAKGLPDSVTRAIGQVGAALQDNAPAKFSFQLGVAPDTNINHATQAQAIDIYGLPFTLNKSAQAQSGLGVTSASDLVLQHKINAFGRVVAEIAESGSLYRDTSFNDVSITANIGPEVFGKAISFHPALIYGERWYGGQPLYTVFGDSLTIKLVASRRAQLVVSTSILRFDYQNRADLSGPLYSGGVSYERALSTRTALRLDVTGAREQAANAAEAFYTLGGAATLSRDAGRFIVYSRLGFSRTIGDAQFIAFGAVARDDRLYEGEIGLIYKRIRIWGLSPLVRAKRAVNTSPLALYAYRQSRFEFALTETF